MLAIHDELAGWFGSFDQYRARGSGKDRSKWLKAYEGGAEPVDRVQRGPVVVPNWSCSVLGYIQPGPMRIGAHWTGLRASRPDEAIRKRIKSKAMRYGKLAMPYILAVNCIDDGAEEADVLDALFGSEQLVEIQTTESPRWIVDRAPDGVWIGPGGPQCTRLSAVLVVDKLQPWTIATATLRLYLNPWTGYPVGSILSGLPRMNPQIVDNVFMLQSADEAAIGTLLGMPSAWPDDGAL